MFSEAVFITACFLILILGFLIGMKYERARHCEEIRQVVLDLTSWCYSHCKIWNDCLSRNKDVYDAWKECQDFCVDCPLTDPVCYESERLKNEDKQGSLPV